MKSGCITIVLKYHHPEKKLAADITIFNGNEEMEPYILNKLHIVLKDKQVWKKYIMGDIKVVPVNGDHFTVFSKKENIEYLSKKWENFFA